MNELNVCLINDSFPPAIDGVANAVTNYARIISQRHGRATVVTPFYPDADDTQFPFPVVRYPSVDMTKQIGYRAGIPFAPELIMNLEQQGYSIIHSHCPVTSTVFARELRERIHVPIVFTYHTKFDIDIANAVKSRLLQEEAARLLVQNIQACDEVWTVSRGAGANLESLGYEGAWQVMPNGVDLPRGRVPQAQIAAATAGYDLPEKVPVFLFVGRMMWYKGIRLILDALGQLARAGREFRMVFVGGGGDKEEIVSYSHSLDLDRRVFFVPPIHDREQLRAWYCRADLFLFPSTFDTNGLVVREAAACGLASVLISGSCAAEDVLDGVNGFCIRESADDMAALLAGLLGDREKMQQVGQNAQDQLYLSWEDAVGNACRRYGEVTENYARGLYPRRRDAFDELYSAASPAIDGATRRREQRQAAYAQHLNTLTDLLTGLRNDRTRLKRKLEARLEDLEQKRL
ncbi:MAG: glycosyltransferase [Eubacteriales bacterium]|nr:glycosyltransferase [Eubacteriales bacterium]